MNTEHQSAALVLPRVSRSRGGLFLPLASAPFSFHPGSLFQAVTGGNRSKPTFDAMGAKKCVGSNTTASRGGFHRPDIATSKSKEAVHEFFITKGRTARSFTSGGLPWQRHGAQDTPRITPSKAHAAPAIHGASL